MTPARKQLEALEPLVVAATIQLLDDKIAMEADPMAYLGTQKIDTSNLDQTTCLFSLAISLRRIADSADTLVKLARLAQDE